MAQLSSAKREQGDETERKKNKNVPEGDFRGIEDGNKPR